MSRMYLILCILGWSWLGVTLAAALIWRWRSGPGRGEGGVEVVRDGDEK